MSAIFKLNQVPNSANSVGNPSVPARPLLRPLGVLAQDARQDFGDRPGGQLVAVLVLQVAVARTMTVLLLPPAVGALQPPLPLVLGDPALTCLCVRVAFMN